MKSSYYKEVDMDVKKSREKIDKAILKVKSLPERQADMNAKLKEIQMDMAKNGIQINMPIFTQMNHMPQIKG